MFWYIGVFVFLVSICSAVPRDTFQPDEMDPYGATVDITAQEDLAEALYNFQGLYNGAMSYVPEHADSTGNELIKVTTEEGSSIGKRGKRSPITLVARALIRAIGAKEVKTRSKRFRLYEKKGNYEAAKADFYSLSPRNVKEVTGSGRIYKTRFTQGKILTGTVGDKRIYLREYGLNGDGYRPTIEVTETKITPGPYIDKIVYKNEK